MLACRGTARWALAACAVAALALCAGPASASRRTTRSTAKKAVPTSQQTGAAQTAPAFTPGVTLATEVMTPQGQPRMYPVGGGNMTPWQPGMPVFIGDRIILRPFVSTGSATLREVRVRLDNEPLMTMTQAPWVVNLDTTNWTPGYHFVEVFAQSTDANAPLGSATAIFFARTPQPAVAAATPPEATVITESTVTATTEMTPPEPVTPGAEATLPQPETAEAETGTVTAVAGARQTPEQAPAHPGRAVPMSPEGVPQYQATLDARIHSRDATAEQGIQAGQMVTVSAPTLFYVQGGSAARFFVYALTRDGREIFRSEPLPINSLVRLQPKMDAQGVGLNPGEVSLWVWASDGQDLFGAPDMVRVNIVRGS